MHIAKKVLLLICGFIETVIFSGIILGWASLLYILKEEGVYSHVCSNSTSTLNNYNGNSNLSIEETLPIEESKITFTNDKQITCSKQDDILNMAFTAGTFSTGGTAIIWGFILDHWGLRITRLLLNVQLLIGTILLTLTSTNAPYLLFPGIILVCMSGLPVRMTNLEVANLFPKYRSTIITIFTGTFNASAFVFALLKVFYDVGLSWKLCSLILVVLSASMFLVTFLLLPRNRIIEEEYMKIKNKNFPKASSNRNTPSNSTARRNSELTVEDYGPDQNAVPIRSERALPLRSTLLSASYLLHCWWYIWTVTEIVVYVGLLSVWLKRITSDDSAAGNYTKMYGFTQIFGLILAPLPGIFMDWLSNRASKDPDTLKRKEKMRNVGFWPLMVTTTALAATLVCQFFNSTSALFFSMVFNTIMRSFQGPVANAHLRTKFPKEQFNRLQGISGTLAGFATVSQYAFFMWSSESEEAFHHVNILCCILTLIAFLNPVHLLIPFAFRKQDKIPIL